MKGFLLQIWQILFMSLNINKKLKFLFQDGTFFEIADDILPRYITCMTILDYNTICGGDKFENFFVLRLPMSKN